jgi:hypothetical protein
VTTRLEKVLQTISLHNLKKILVKKEFYSRPSKKMGICLSLLDTANDKLNPSPVNLGEELFLKYPSILYKLCTMASIEDVCVCVCVCVCACVSMCITRHFFEV